MRFNKIILILLIVLISIISYGQVYPDEIELADSTNSILFAGATKTYQHAKLEVRNDSLCIEDGDCFLSMFIALDLTMNDSETIDFTKDALNIFHADVDTSIISTIHYTDSLTSASSLWSESGSDIYFDTGKVGIGTTTPAYDLEVNSTDVSQGGRFGSAFVGNWTTASYLAIMNKTLTPSNQYAMLQSNSGETFLNSASGKKMHFRIANFDKAVIDSNGKFGIGTTTPSSLLHVNGTTRTEDITFPGRGFIGTAGTGINIQTVSGDIEFDPYGNSIFSNGNVGIGTSTPSNLLHVQTTSASDGIRVSGSGSPSWYLQETGQEEWRFAAAGSGLFLKNDGDNQFRLNQNGDISFYNWLGSEEFYWDAYNSRIGIGTTTPNYLLSVGEATVGSVIPNTNLYIEGAGGSSETTLQNRVFVGLNNNQGYGSYLGHINTDYSTGQVAVIGTRYSGVDYPAIYTRQGNTGLGTNSPVEKLDIRGGLNVQDGSAQGILVGADLDGITRTAATRKFFRMGASHYDIAEQPIGLFTVDGNSTYNYVSIGGGNSSQNAATTLKFFTGANNTTTTGTERMTIRESGRVGINNTNPQVDLHVMGNIRAESTLNPYIQTRYTGGAYMKMQSLINGGYIGTENAHDVTFITSNSPKMHIDDSSGNVGIGTTTPDEKLEVYGNILIDKENSGIIIDASGNRRYGFMKYTGQNTAFSIANNQELSFGHITGSDVTSGTGFSSAMNITESAIEIENKLLFTGSNVSIGSENLSANNLGARNVNIGYASLWNNLIGNNNVSIGRTAGYSSTGSGNVYLGYQSGYYNTSDNKLYIENSTSSTPLVGGDFSANQVGINRAIGSIGYTLDVGGDIGVQDDLFVLDDANVSGNLDVAGEFLVGRYTAAIASGLSKTDGIIIYLTSTDATFTSVGFWGVEAGTWIKL